MANPTTNLSMTKPTVGGSTDTWGTTLNENVVDIIDALFSISGTDVTMSDIKFNSMSVQETGAGTDTVKIQAPAAVTTSYTLTMPAAVGSTDQVLSAADGSGTLAWTTPETGDITAVTAGTGMTGGGSSGDVTLNVIGTSGTITVSADAVTIASDYVGQSTITTLGTIGSLVATTADINAGTFDGIVGGTTPADGSFTTLSATGNVTMSADASVGDDLTLGSDAAILNFGADSDVSLTHVHDTGLLLNSTRQLRFFDGSQYIAAASASQLDIVASDEIQLDATAIDLNGTLDVSGTTTLNSDVSVTGDLVVSGTGPHAIGGAANGPNRLTLTGSFTSDGSSTSTRGLAVEGALTGAAGDTTRLVGSQFANTVVTQTATENVGLIAQAVFFAPGITDNLTGDITIAATVYIDGSPSAGETDAALYVASGNVLLSPTSKLYLDSGGDTYITEASANLIKFVTGGADGVWIGSGGLYIGVYNGDNQIIDASTGGGSSTLYIGNQAITTSSDRRLKTNIVDSSLNAVDALNQLRVTDFNWDDPSDTSFNNRNARGLWTGMIAQEVVEHLPFAVNAPRDENKVIDHDYDSPWSIDPLALCGVLVKAVQELSGRIEALEA